MTADAYESHLQTALHYVAQAQQVAAQDFAQARALWQQAGKAFYHAHRADPTRHEAAYRLAQAWAAEAHALQKEASANAAIMWRNAASQGELAFELRQDHAPTAMLVASCYAWLQDMEAAEGWAKLARHLQGQGAQPAADDPAG